jgi:hypothetical protein
MVIFCCPKCGAGYEAKQARHAFLGFRNFNCHICRAKVFEWSGVFDYVDWKAAEVTPGVERR